MVETMSRVEIEDLFRHLTTKVDRAQLQAACAMEEAKCLSHALEVACYQIRQLTTWLVPLLSAEQQEVIGVERRAGVTDEPLVSDDVVEPNDGDTWRARLRQCGLGKSIGALCETVDGPTLSAREVEAFKSIGALFSPSTGGGPCFNRDDDGRRAGETIVDRDADFLG